MTIFTLEDEQQIAEWSIGKTALAKPTTFSENVASSWNEFRGNNSSGAYRSQIRDAYQRRIDTVRQLTGVKLDTPYYDEPQFIHNLDSNADLNPDALDPYSRFMFGANQFMQNPLVAIYRAFDDHEGNATEYQRIQAHELEIEKARNSLPPNKRALIPTKEELTKKLQADAQRREAINADIAGRATFTGTLGQMAGTMGAATVQPEVLITLPLGAPARIGLLGRVLADAAIGGGTEALMQPGIQQQREDLGLDSGFAQGVENVVGAAGGAATFSGAAHILAKVLKGGSKAFKEHYGRDPTADELAAIDLAQQAVKAEENSPYVQASAETARVFQQNEQIATAAAIEGRAVKSSELIKSSEAVQTSIQKGANLEVLRNADLDKIEVDATLMQFKAGGDEFGVTDRLRGVEEWINERAGLAMVYEYADGRRIIADGHQRLGLAKRLAANGQDVELPAYVMREIDGITPAQARARAAFKNIAEGSGSAADAAKVLRDMGATVSDLNLPPKSALVRDAEGLAAVNDEVFGLVVNEILEDRFAAAIGRLVNDPFLQTNIANLLVRLKPSNVFEAEQIIDQARRAGVSHETQTNLFGETQIANSLYLERARVLDRSLKMLKRNRETFKNLLENEGQIVDAGNILDQGANASRLEEQGRVEAYLRAAANRKGSISDALTEAARAARESGQYQKPARDFLEALRTGIDDGSVARNSGRANRVVDEFAAADSARARIDEPAAGEPTVIDDLTLNMFEDPAGDAAQKQSAGIAREVITSADGAEVRDFPVPIGQSVDAEGNIVSEMKTVGQVIDDLESDQHFLDQLEICAAE